MEILINLNPAKAGVYDLLKFLDSRFRGNDETVSNHKLLTNQALYKDLQLLIKIRTGLFSYRAVIRI